MNQNRYKFTKQENGSFCLGIKLVSVENLAVDLPLWVKGLLFQAHVTEYIRTNCA